MIKIKYSKRLICLILSLTLCIGLLAGCSDRGDGQAEESPHQEAQGDGHVEQDGNQDSAQERFDELLDELFTDVANSDSITLNYFVADPSRFGIVPAQPTFGEVTSQESILRDREENRELRERLEEFHYESLRPEQQYIFDILMRNLDLIEVLDAEDDYSYYIGSIYPVSGVQAIMPVLLAEFNFRTVEDIEIYLALLGDTERYFSDLIEFERERSRRGFFMSDANTDTVIESCESFLDNRGNNLLIVVFNDKIDQHDDLSTEQREEFKRRNRELVLNNVLPSYEMLISAMRELRGRGANQDGLAALPNGMEFAQAYLQYKTGSDREPAQVESMMRSEMERALDGIWSIFGSNPALHERFSRGEAGEINDEEPGVYMRLLEKSTMRDFPEIDPVRYVVNEVHESMQEFLSPAFYLTPALDSFTDNVIYINPEKITDNLSLFTTLAHEGYPGHMYQKVFYFQHSPHPLRTFIGNTGYTEGWATYVEMLSYFYAGLDEEEATLMQLMQVYNIMLISLVDLGVNALGWGFDGTAEFLRNRGFSDEETVRDVFNTVTADPLSYLPYALGYLEFTSLRAEASSSLEQRFEPVEFHRFLLEIGSSPFSLIRAQMQIWIDGQAAGALAPAA